MNETLAKVAPQYFPVYPTSKAAEKLTSIGVAGRGASSVVDRIENGDCDLHEWRIFNRYR